MKPFRLAFFGSSVIRILLATVFFLGAPIPAQAGSEESEPRSSFPLRTQGRYILDATGKRFWLKSVNWWGAHTEGQVPSGLEHQHISRIIGLIQEWGFNSVRLPFSNQMLHDPKPVKPESIAANPEWIGLTPLQIFDQTVQALTQAGIAVILNNHTTTSEWCCNYDYNGLWHHQSTSRSIYSQTPQMWQNDWVMMAQRYRQIPGVVGADLRNEVRTARWADTYLPSFPNWGKGGINDWHQAAQDAGNAILQVNPDLLIVVEGVNWSGIVNFYGMVPECWMGGRPVLKPVREKPIRLQIPNRVVYAAHQYHFTGSQNTGERRTSGNHPCYSELDDSTWKQVTFEEWGYLLEVGKTYSAPVWLSEFGAPPQAEAAHQAWLKRLVDYLIENEVDFAFWPLNGNDSWGLVSKDWSHLLNDDWRYPLLKRLIDSRERKQERL